MNLPHEVVWDIATHALSSGLKDAYALLTTCKLYHESIWLSRTFWKESGIELNHDRFWRWDANASQESPSQESWRLRLSSYLKRFGDVHEAFPKIYRLYNSCKLLSHRPTTPHVLDDDSKIWKQSLLPADLTCFCRLMSWVDPQGRYVPTVTDLPFANYPAQFDACTMVWGATPVEASRVPERTMVLASTVPLSRFRQMVVYCLEPIPEIDCEQGEILWLTRGNGISSVIRKFPSLQVFLEGFMETIPKQQMQFPEAFSWFPPTSQDTEGIRVTVRYAPLLESYDANYIPSYTSIWSYRIHIHATEQMTRKHVYLQRRHWEIQSAHQNDTVDDIGVVGYLPRFVPGQFFTYTSFCGLEDQVGRMWGYYTFSDLDTGESFRVYVPEMRFDASQDLGRFVSGAGWSKGKG